MREGERERQVERQRGRRGRGKERFEKFKDIVVIKS